MLSAPTGNGEMQAADLEIMLGEMIDCGREFERRALAGERYPFAVIEAIGAEVMEIVDCMTSAGTSMLGRSYRRHQWQGPRNLRRPRRGLRRGGARVHRIAARVGRLDASDADPFPSRQFFSRSG